MSPVDGRPPLGRILTFYSYKGGTGRSMAVANIAWILASAGRRVLMIDWDLEAPGLHRYFRPFLLDDELTASDGIIDIVERYANEAIRPIDPKVPTPPDWYLPYADFTDDVLSINYDHFAAGGRLDFLPAGRQGEAYALKVSAFNWQNLYDRLGGGGFFEALKRRAREEYDYVLIDSRTGVSDTAGICSVQMPDTLVVCFTYNNQSIKGASGIATWAKHRQERLVQEYRAKAVVAPATTPVVQDSLRPYRIFPIPMRVEPGERDRLMLRQTFARDAFRPLTAHLAADLADYWGYVEVPHNVFYAYEEVLAPFTDNPNDPKSVLATFVRIASYLTDRDVTEYRLTVAPAERQRLLEAFAMVPGAGATVAPIAPVETEEETLVRTADAALASFSDVQRQTVQRIFSRLVRLGREEEGGGVFPIRASLGDFSADEQSAISLLAAQGLVSVTSDARQGQTVSIADPRLTIQWKTLLGWLDRDREFLIWRQQMRSYLADWERSGREDAQLLGGTLLGEALPRIQKRRADLNEAEQEYLNHSVSTMRRIEAARLEAARGDTARIETARAGERFEAPLGADSTRSSTLSRSPASAPPGAPPQTWSPSPPSRATGAMVRASWVPALVAGVLFFAAAGSTLYNRWGKSPQSAVILAAATAATADPLQRALLLLELEPSVEAPSNAKDLAIELATTPLPYAVLHNEAHPITALRFRADSQMFLVGSSDGTVTVWRAGASRTPAVIATRVGAVVSVSAAGPAGRVLVTGQNHLAELWDVDANKLIDRLRLPSDLLAGTVVGGLPVTVQQLSAYPKGGAVTPTVAQSLDLRPDATMEREFKRLATLPPDTKAVAFSASGSSTVAVTGEQIHTWELPSGTPGPSFPVAGPSKSLAVAPNGAYLAVATGEGVVIWSLTAAKNTPANTLKILKSDTASRVLPEPAMAISSDGNVIALTFADGSARLLPATSEILTAPPAPTLGPYTGPTDPAVFRGHKGAIVDLVFSADGSAVATAGADGTIRLWENPIGRTPPTRPSASSSWSELWNRLRRQTNACLTANERIRLLNESESSAQAAAAKCETNALKTLAPPRKASAS
jgi:MinD-like ATPase involved in chromosome partitioning or flagellar assembly/WD40 repeat protein